MHLLLLLLLLGPTAETTPTAQVALDSTTGPIQQEPLVSDSVFSVASTRYTYDWISETNRSAWHRREVTLETPLPQGVLVTSLTQQRRFQRNEVSGKAHYWTGLWNDSYGHIHFSLGPNVQTMPRLSAGAELYEMIGDWELSGWYEWRRYANTDVHVMGPQIARYLGDWYLRTRTSLIEREGTWAATQFLSVRRYLGSSTTYVEGQVGYGRTIEFVHPTRPLQISRSYSASVRLRHFITSTFGISMAGNYSNDVFRRAGVSAGLMVRW